MKKQADEDRDVDTVAQLLVDRNPHNWLRLIELVNVTEIVSVARALIDLRRVR
jgi:hypothetical protein